MFNLKPEKQKTFKQGYRDYFSNKEKKDNPWKRIMTLNANQNAIYWDMGWEKGNQKGDL